MAGFSLQRLFGIRLVTILLASVAAFATASVLAAVGYPGWLWWPVFAGLVVPPAVVLVLGSVALWGRLRPD